MKKYTLEELKQFPNTLMEYMKTTTDGYHNLEDAKKYYKIHSKSKYKKRNLNRFLKMYTKDLAIWNNRIK